jgi:hypothetical protein
MVVMRIPRAAVAAALGMMALTSAACSSGTAVPPVGKVCGVTRLGGGPGQRADPALLHVCPSGPEVARRVRFSLMATNGKRYTVSTYRRDQWSATVPAGNYRAVGAPGCPRAEPQFMVSTGKTLKGVIVWTGCDYK